MAGTAGKNFLGILAFSVLTAVICLTGCIDEKRSGTQLTPSELKAPPPPSVSAEKKPVTVSPPSVLNNNKLHIKQSQTPDIPLTPVLSAEERLPELPVSLNMVDEELQLILRALAKIAGQSIMISDTVRGKATISIENESWRQIFISLLKTYSLNYEWLGNIVRVYTVDDMNAELKQLEITQRKAEKKREIEVAAPIINGIVRIHFSDAENLKGIFEQFLQGSDAGKQQHVMVDKHTNSLIVQATEKEINSLRELVLQIDRPTPQIRIEARIVEASKEAAEELGVEWGGLYKRTNGDRNFWITPGLNSGQTSSGENTDTDGTGVGSSGDGSLVPAASDLIQSLPAVISGSTGLNVGFVFQKAGRYELGVQLSALQSDGKLNILSSPSISTLDNQKAMIESGREIPFQTVEDGETKIEYKKAVLNLEVTPHVIYNDLLKLKIVTNKDELDFSTSVNGNPVILTKKAQTNVVLRDGQTTVIGGLRKENNYFSEMGVPYLSDIPLLGRLFQRHSQQDTMEEVLIFITPHIIAMPVYQRIGAAGNSEK